MKIVLINTRSKKPEEIQQKWFAPINLLYIASSLVDNGHDVQLIDANAFGLTDAEITKMIKGIQPGLVGISLLSEILPQTYRLIGCIRAANPDAKIVLGGPHVNEVPEKVMEVIDRADYVLRGESEKSIVMLCRALEDKIKLEEVSGLYYRDNGKIIKNRQQSPGQDLDGIKRPERDLLINAYTTRKYYMVLVKQRPVETLITSRGCPFHCSFCSNIPGEYRARSPENVLEEIVDRYTNGIRNFDIADANFTFDHSRAMQIFNMIIKEKLNISFRFKSRTRSVTEELVLKAKHAGAYLVSLGMESGSQRMLNRMKKKTQIADNIMACETVMNAGLKLNTGWIIGYPGETRETVGQTVDLIIKVKPTTANIGRLVPYPGTDVYEETKADKTLVGDWDTGSDFIPWVRLPWIKTLNELEKITQWAKNRVYYRPHYMLNFTKEIIGNFNITLAQYALQEVKKSFLLMAK